MGGMELFVIGCLAVTAYIIINSAKSLYSIVSKTKISRGNNRKGIIAACVYFACKECDVGRSSKEIAEMFNVVPTVMTKGVKKCQEIIHFVVFMRCTQIPDSLFVIHTIRKKYITTLSDF